MAFVVLVWAFGIAFTFDVLSKASVLRHRFVFSAWNIFDLAIVFFWLLFRFEGLEALSGPMNPMVFCVCRLVRLCRLARLARMTAMFDTLVLMIISARASIGVLFWGIILLFATVTISARVLQSLPDDFVSTNAPGVEKSHRHAVYRLFGTCSRFTTT